MNSKGKKNNILYHKFNRFMKKHDAGEGGSQLIF